MSGPTCRNPDCPPCQDPEQIDCPTCHGTGRLSTSEGETIARAFHAAYEDLAPRLLDAGVIAPASSNPVSSAPGPRVSDSETHSRIGSETPDERSEGSRIAAPVSREQDFDGRDRQVKGAGCDEPDQQGRIQELEAQRDEAWRNAITHKERAGDLEERVLELEGVLEWARDHAENIPPEANPWVELKAIGRALRSTLSNREGDTDA